MKENIINMKSAKKEEMQKMGFSLCIPNFKIKGEHCNSCIKSFRLRKSHEI